MGTLDGISTNGLISLKAAKDATADEQFHALCDAASDTCVIRYKGERIFDNTKYMGVFGLQYCVFTQDPLDTANYLCPEVCIDGIDRIRQPTYVYTSETTKTAAVTATTNNGQWHDVAYQISVIGNTLRLHMEPKNIYNQALADGKKITTAKSYRILFSDAKTPSCTQAFEFSEKRNFTSADDFEKYDEKTYVVEYEYQRIMHLFTEEESLFIGLCQDEDDLSGNLIMVEEITKFVTQFDTRRELTSNQSVLIGFGLFFICLHVIMVIVAAVICCCRE